MTVLFHRFILIIKPLVEFLTCRVQVKLQLNIVHLRPTIVIRTAQNCEATILKLFNPDALCMESPLIYHKGDFYRFCYTRIWIFSCPR